MDYHVHIGFGFHVNCYHSYRGDTNDELGFGGDIRIIRRILEILDACNQEGIPVKGTWDFENYYSLEKILPRYAPDIVDAVRRRVERCGDENIIMGYNNGALSAMTEDEFNASIEWSIHNEAGSGLADLFGSCEKIVRPQEVMFTPSQARLYRKLGVKAVCLYYSCVPFDAFRTLIPQLPDEYALNPLTYTYLGDSVTILPTYSNSDVIDAGSLRYLARGLHAKQERGEIQHDVFLFINMDADAILWEPLGLPFPLNRIANTDGIRGLVREIADLDFVRFDTPGGYLRTHRPLKEITFTQDTADGSFTGYSSWAEKPFNRQIWTRLERARAYARAAGKDADSPSFADRVRLLSTTHFGLASPVLNIEREKSALALSERTVRLEAEQAEKPNCFTLIPPDGGTLACTQLSLDAGLVRDAAQMEVRGEGLLHYGVVPMDAGADGTLRTVFLIGRFDTPRPSHPLEFTVNPAKPGERAAATHVDSESLSVRLCEHGEVLSVRYRGRQIGGKDFLRSYLTYGGAHYQFTNKRLSPLPCGGEARGVRVTGEIHLPGELEAGRFTIDLFTVPEVDCVFLQPRVRYPYTKEEHAISTQSSALGRYSDMRWEEAVPLQLRPLLGEDVRVVKRNFMGDVSAFSVESFARSVPENRELASFNHQLTGGFTGLSDGKTGILLASARQVLNSMASCPMRLTRTATGKPVVSINPFGTYYGRQRKHPTRSNGAVGESFVVVAPQARSLAPSYNGVEENAMLALFAFDGPMPAGEVLADSCAFADGAVVWENGKGGVHACGADNVRFPSVRPHPVSSGQLKSAVVSGVTPGLLKMASIAVRAFGNIIVSQIRANRR